jgi:hypothetical protein
MGRKGRNRTPLTGGRAIVILWRHCSLSGLLPESLVSTTGSESVVPENSLYDAVGPDDLLYPSHNMSWDKSVYDRQHGIVPRKVHRARLGNTGFSRCYEQGSSQ